MPEFKIVDLDGKTTKKKTQTKDFDFEVKFQKLNLEGKATIENPIFSLIEAVCISWFTIEYFLRLAGFLFDKPPFVSTIAQQLLPIPTVVIPRLGAPEKLKFLKGPLNIVDILAILPYYLSLAFTEEVRNLSYPIPN